jgi:hypothetical protein
LSEAELVKESIKKRYLSFLPQKIDIDQTSTELRNTGRFGHFVYGDKVRAILDTYASKDQQD